MDRFIYDWNLIDINDIYLWNDDVEKCQIMKWNLTYDLQYLLLHHRYQKICCWFVTLWMIILTERKPVYGHADLGSFHMTNIHLIRIWFERDVFPFDLQ